MTRTVLVLILTLATAPLVSAHEGHAHKIMGTVVTVQANQLKVKGTDGKMSKVTVTDKTKVIHGIMAMKPADIKTGDRVVVTATGGGKEPLVAKQIQLGAVAAAKPATKK
jgi:hypothetical protein